MQVFSFFRKRYAIPLASWAIALVAAGIFSATAFAGGNLCADMYNWTSELDFSHCAQLGDYNASAGAHELHYGYENETDEWRLFTLTFTWGGGGKKVMKDVPVAPREKAVRAFHVKDAGEIQPYISIEAKPWPKGRKKEKKSARQPGKADARPEVNARLEKCRKFEGTWGIVEYPDTAPFRYVCSPEGELQHPGAGGPGNNTIHIDGDRLIFYEDNVTNGFHTICDAEAVLRGNTMKYQGQCFMTTPEGEQHSDTVSFTMTRR